MWKLTITQKRESEYSGNIISESTVFTAKQITELTAMIDRLSAYEGVVVTTYKLEKVGATNE